MSFVIGRVEVGFCGWEVIEGVIGILAAGRSVGFGVAEMAWREVLVFVVRNVVIFLGNI